MHILKICAIVISSIFLFLVLAVLIINAVFQAVYKDFYKRADRTFKIPGLNAGFVPQGIEETERGIIISGYMKDGTASRIYLLNEDDVTHVEIFNQDGTPYTGHCGGVDVHGGTVLLTGDTTVELLSLNEIASGGRATVKGSFDPGLIPAWCTVRGEHLFVGSFANSSGDAYPPSENEIFTTPCGDRNISLIKVFKFNDAAPLGIDQAPLCVISSGERVQGLSFIDDATLMISTSYGLSSSRLIAHSTQAMISAVGEYITADGTVPLFYLDSASELYTVKAPPMSEELMIKDGYVYILNESACTKYIFGKFLGLDRVMRYKLR